MCAKTLNITYNKTYGVFELKKIAYMFEDKKKKKGCYKT